MHTVEILEQALIAAEQLGYRIRQEWLGGTAGGRCEFAGQKWIFIDLGLSVSEQLDQVLEALREDRGVCQLRVSQSLSELLGARRAA